MRPRRRRYWRRQGNIGAPHTLTLTGRGVAREPAKTLASRGQHVLAVRRANSTLRSTCRFCACPLSGEAALAISLAPS